MNSWWLVICAIVLSLLALAGINEWCKRMHARPKWEKEGLTQQPVPLVFVPGSSATQERFNPLFRRLRRKGIYHSLLKVTVAPDGSYQASGAIDPRDPHPFIVIAFSENRDREETIYQQGVWLQMALEDLSQQYGFEQVRAIGHSNGGLNWSIFLTQQRLDSPVWVESLLMMGSPFNLRKRSLTIQDPFFKGLLKHGEMERPPRLVRNLAGSRDRVVHPTSVEMGGKLFAPHVSDYQFQLLSGRKTGHSLLPIHGEVLTYLAAMSEEEEGM